MFQSVDTHPEFESLARQYLAKNPSIRHEWRAVRSIWWGGRTDLLCEPGSSREVYASLFNAHIAIGSGADCQDFEDFGRGLSSAALAREAFAHFVDLLKQNGIVAGNHEA